MAESGYYGNYSGLDSHPGRGLLQTIHGYRASAAAHSYGIID